MPEPVAIRVPKFNGNPHEDADEHLDSFEEIMMDHGVVGDKSYTDRFQCTLRRAALTWMKALPPATRNSWGNLSAAFLGEYRPTDYIRELKASMYAWSQEQDETIEDYVDRCRHLWNKMNLTTDEEMEDAKHFFIKGLRNNPFLEEMFAEHDTLLDCFTIALKHSKKMRVPLGRMSVH